ncbi:HAD hydrolase-like protein, partial [Enterococcus faecium]|uniref:HAD hydrolase-like protein n=1 Tax=Enterococcus faecium TaxID=1352 RepID=UPI00325E67E8
MFDSYIWDFDGTLFDTYPIMLDSMMKALEDRQVVADPKAVYRLLKEKSSKALTEKYHLDFREFSDDFHQYETLDTRQPVTFDHVYDTLDLSQYLGHILVETVKPFFLLLILQ